MTTEQFWVIIGLMGAGFGGMMVWLRSIDRRLNHMETCLTVMETVLAMMGVPVKPGKTTGD